MRARGIVEVKRTPEKEENRPLGLGMEARMEGWGLLEWSVMVWVVPKESNMH